MNLLFPKAHVEVENPKKGFGEYTLADKMDHKSYIKAHKTYQIGVLVLLGVIGAALTALFFLPLAFPVWALKVVAAGQILGLVEVVRRMVRSVIAYRALNKLAPSTETLPFKGPGVGVWNHQPLKTYPLANSQNSNKTKLDIIKKAKESIVWSGSYCGGKVFDEALGIIEQKLKNNELKEVIIMTSNYFLTAQNKKTLERLENEYKQVFQAVIHTESDVAETGDSSHFMSSTNHVKALVVDGTLAVVGGTGLTDTWAENKKGSALNVLPTSYSDTDYLLQSNSKKSLVQGLYAQLRKLHAITAYRNKDPKIFEELKQKPFLPPLIPHTFNLKGGEKMEGAKILLAFPEQKEMPIMDEMIKMVENAKEEIFIGHMYFHPPQRLKKAMLSALDRGVKFTILTNGYDQNSPGAHFFYAALSKVLLDELKEKAAFGQVQIFENREVGNTFHHKFFAVDDEVIIGSANLGHRSLKNADYELSILLRSKPFILKAKAEILEQIKAFKDISYKKPSFFTKIAAKAQHIIRLVP